MSYERYRTNVQLEDVDVECTVEVDTITDGEHYMGRWRDLTSYLTTIEEVTVKGVDITPTGNPTYDSIKLQRLWKALTMEDGHEIEFDACEIERD